MRRTLRGRGLDGADADDATQEVAIRALTAWRRQAITTSFTGWCVGTAKHVACDTTRRSSLLAPLCEATEPAEATSIDERIEGRLDLVGATRAWAQLTDDERNRLLAPSPPAGATAAERNRFYVSLHRLRRRTRDLAESLTPLVLWARRFDLPALAPAAETAAVAAAVVMAGLVPATPAPPARHVPPRSASVVARATIPARAPGPPADAPAVPGHRTTARRDRVAEVVPDGRHHVSTPASQGIDATTYERDDPPIACASGPPLPSRTCIDYPVRPRLGAR